MCTDPDLLFSSLRIRISMTVPTQFYQHLNNLFSANFYLFFAGFLQEKLRFFTENTHENPYFLCLVKARVERVGRPPRPFPASRTLSGVWARGHGSHTRVLQEAGGR